MEPTVTLAASNVKGAGRNAAERLVESRVREGCTEGHVFGLVLRPVHICRNHDFMTTGPRNNLTVLPPSTKWDASPSMAPPA